MAMQPQEGGSIDWMHAVSALGGAVIGAISGLMAGVFGLAERGIEQRVEKKIVALEKRTEDRIDEEIGHFRETLSGLREQINKSATRKDLADFRKESREDLAQHRKESREDTAALEHNIAAMLGRKS
jgi:gas vesicle protein